MRRLLRCASATLLVIAAACSIRSQIPVTAYADLLVPAPLLAGASPLATGWSVPTLNHSGYSRSGTWVATGKSTGSFTCHPDDREALAAALLVAFKEDLFGQGFQLREEAVLKVGAVAAPDSFQIQVPFEDDVELGVLDFVAKEATEFTSVFTLTVSEERR
ncbi:MAG: hypothetical protein H8D72_00535 [Planctomycetes bacterium]|nr:hypothetical protein [Planctomycetota bacterium]